jgi:uncharacterized integral membrane protein (TIGR00697 family)
MERAGRRTAMYKTMLPGSLCQRRPQAFIQTRESRPGVMLVSVQPTMTRSVHAPQHRFLDVLQVAFVVVLLVSNLLAQKICRIGPFAVSGAILLFPITYIFGDIFTEVYGYAASRRAIWLGFFAQILLYATAAATIALPADPEWHNQSAFSTVFGFVPRIVAASLIAFWAGEFANSYVMARLKLATEGRWLWTRTIGSTVVGQAIDTLLVISLTFGGTVSGRTIASMILTAYALKVGYEVLATPITYAVISALKHAEGGEVTDTHTSFNPFRFFKTN